MAKRKEGGLSLLPFAILLNFYCCCTSATRFVSLQQPQTEREREREKKTRLSCKSFAIFLFLPPLPALPTPLCCHLLCAFPFFCLFSLPPPRFSICFLFSVSFSFLRFVLLNLFASFLICTSLHFIVIYNLICTAIAPSRSHTHTNTHHAHVSQSVSKPATGYEGGGRERGD